MAALEALERARNAFETIVPLLEIDRVRALLAAGRIRDAEQALGKCAALRLVPADLLEPASVALADVSRRRGRALVVGVGAYDDTKIDRPLGARADAEAFAAMLTRFGFVKAEDVVLLLDEDATRQRILSEFQMLAQHGIDELAVFYFAGVGSWVPEAGSTILSVDARTLSGDEAVEDIPLVELADASTTSHNLVAIIDAGTQHVDSARPQAGKKLLPRVEGSRTTPPSDSAGRQEHDPSGDELVVGAVTLVPAVPKRAKNRSVERSMSPSGTTRGRLTLGFEQALERARARQEFDSLTYVDLTAFARLRGRAAVAGAAAPEPVLRHRTAIARADAALREFELRPVRSCLALASELIKEAETRDESAPRSHLVAGLALDALGDHSAAIQRLRASRNLADEGAGSSGRWTRADPDPEEWYRWASHHLGRILYEQGGDLHEAVAALRAANTRKPDEPRTSYHLAQALNTLIQRESLREVELHLLRYLDLGAPLGNVDRVREILASIDGT